MPLKDTKYLLVFMFVFQGEPLSQVYLYLTKNCATFNRSPLTRLHIATKSSLSNAFGEFDLPSQGISASDVVAATDVVAVVGW